MGDEIECVESYMIRNALFIIIDSQNSYSQLECPFLESQNNEGRWKNQGVQMKIPQQNFLDQLSHLIIQLTNLQILTIMIFLNLYKVIFSDRQIFLSSISYILKLRKQIKNHKDINLEFDELQDQMKNQITNNLDNNVQNQRSFQIALGQNSFTHRFSRQILPSLNPHMLTMFLNEKWVFELDTQKTQQLARVLRQLQSTECKFFTSTYVFGTCRYYCLKNNFSMLNCITHVQFSSLKELKLSYNHIQNIEAIGCLNMQTLQKLILNGNLITSFKALDKANWPQLNKVDIQGNHAHRVDISRVRTNIILQLSYQQGFQPVDFQDTRWITKIQSKRLTTNEMNAKNSTIGMIFKKKLAQKSLSK